MRQPFMNHSTLLLGCNQLVAQRIRCANGHPVLIEQNLYVFPVFLCYKPFGSIQGWPNGAESSSCASAPRRFGDGT